MTWLLGRQGSQAEVLGSLDRKRPASHPEALWGQMSSQIPNKKAGGGFRRGGLGATRGHVCTLSS